MSKPKLLVTGGGGFIGSHLSELLVNEGYIVKVFIHYNSKNQWGWVENSEYKSEMEVVTGDIRDYDSVYSAMEDCQIVYHLAALIAIPYSYISPMAYIKTNIEGTYNVLQSARIHNIDKVIVTSTSETYGSAQYVPINEDHPMVGQSPYSASKISADQLAISYYRSFDLPVKIVRPFNTYGPRQSARAIIPTVITQIFTGKNEIQLGNLHPTRDLTFVKDTVSGFLAIEQAEGLWGEITNIGMSDEISIRDLVNMIVMLMDTDVKIIEDSKRNRSAKSEVDRLSCDNSKILDNTSWKPRYNLKKGLIETIQWIKKNYSIFKPDIYNL